MTVVALLTLVAASATLCASAQPAAAAVERGLFGWYLGPAQSDAATKAKLAAEIADHLRASWVRQDVNWAALEPERGDYNESYLASLDATVGELHARGVKVLLTLYVTPRWASDQSFWGQPPRSLPEGYAPRYPMRDDALDDFGATAAMLAARYRGLVTAYECWNEPNLWPYLYPQRTADDEHFAARIYLKYLKAFSAGVKRGDAAALVVAGATAPIGLNDKYRTSPQTFARFLRDAGAARYFDAYSHHPYTPGGTFDIAPDGRPNDPSTTVTLWNLGQLLALFPDKPFYLTEYGYNTQPSAAFGGFAVTQVQQASFLRRAYAFVARFSQVKVLIWYLVRDAPGPATAPDRGVYTGLRTADGARKLSWFAFAGGNRLTVRAPSRVQRGSLARLRGTLTNRVVGPLAGRRLRLQARPVSGGSWRTIAATRTASGGAYRFVIRPSRTRAYRVVWPGVRESRPRVVRV